MAKEVTAPRRFRVPRLGMTSIAAVSVLLMGLSPLQRNVFVPAIQAEVLIAAGAVVLDARGPEARAPFLPGAHVVDWKSMRAGWGRTGELGDIAEIRATFERVGVSKELPVVIYGSMSDGWGEEGRVWWTLRYLGHTAAYILDGGISVWAKEGHPMTSKSRGPADRKGDLGSSVVPELRTNLKGVEAAIKARRIHILDVRSLAEWNGATPYGEARGGHVPGAKHLEWRSLIGTTNTVLSKQDVLGQLQTLGIDAGDPVIVYCTGGVRSAFVQAVLSHYGFGKVANYDGSWFEWSARSDLPVGK